MGCGKGNEGNKPNDSAKDSSANPKELIYALKLESQLMTNHKYSIAERKNV